jgi:hypothetical protein
VGADFKRLFCQRYGLAPGDFEQKLFGMALFRHALPFVPLLLRWRPEIFREDFDLMREAGHTCSRGELVTELNRFYGRNRRVGGFWRNTCLFRVSGKRVLNIYRELAQEQEASFEASVAPATESR